MPAVYQALSNALESGEIVTDEKTAQKGSVTFPTSQSYKSWKSLISQQKTTHFF